MSNRHLKDRELIKSKALPAAAATSYTDGIDLGQETLGPDGDRMEAEIAIPATPNLAATKTITARLQDSADNETFEDIAALGALTVTGGAAGGAASSQAFRLPRTTRRYIRASFTVAADGGTNTAVSGTLSLLF
jgi:hypothetical protein